MHPLESIGTKMRQRLRRLNQEPQRERHLIKTLLWEAYNEILEGLRDKPKAYYTEDDSDMDEEDDEEDCPTV